MIKIDGTAIAESWEEYAVEPFEDALLYCDTLGEAEDIARLWETHVIVRRYYVTEWSERSA